MKKYSTSVFRKTLGKHPPKRYEFGEAQIKIKPECGSVKQRTFQMVGERRDALVQLIRGLQEEGKIEL